MPPSSLRHDHLCPAAGRSPAQHATQLQPGCAPAAAAVDERGPIIIPNLRRLRAGHRAPPSPPRACPPMLGPHAKKTSPGLFRSLPCALAAPQTLAVSARAALPWLGDQSRRRPCWRDSSRLPSPGASQHHHGITTSIRGFAARFHAAVQRLEVVACA
jgi:hypothetical protein